VTSLIFFFVEILIWFHFIRHSCRW